MKQFLSLMRNIPIGYRTFINSRRQQPTLTLSFLIIDLIQEKTLMKSVNTTNDCPIALFTTKKFYVKKFKDNMCKEGEASSSNTHLENKK